MFSIGQLIFALFFIVSFTFANYIQLQKGQTKKQAIFQREFLGAYRLFNFCQLVGRAKKHRVT